MDLFLTHALDLVTTAMFSLAALVLTGIAFIDALLESVMDRVGLPVFWQIILLTGLSLWFLLVAMRALGGVFTMLLAIFFVLLVMHRILPGLEVPQNDLPGFLQNAAGAMHS